MWNGPHSVVKVEGLKCSITLNAGKNAKGPVTLTRECCCRTTGPRLCSVHWLLRLQAASSTAAVFNVGRAYIKELAAKAGVEHAGRTGTHSFRRGMAQDLMDSTGSLAEVLRELEGGPPPRTYAT